MDVEVEGILTGCLFLCVLVCWIEVMAGRLSRVKAE